MKNVSQTVLWLVSALMLIQFACTKDTNTTPDMVTGTLSDRDGNVYKTIKIGNQTWMAENLKVKTYRNGDSILNVQDTKKWMSALPAYCLENKVNKNFLLYNWYALNDPRKFAPAGLICIYSLMISSKATRDFISSQTDININLIGKVLLVNLIFI